MKNFYIKLMFLVIVMVLVALSLMTYRNLNNYVAEVNHIRHSRDVFRALDQTLSTIKDAEIGSRGFELTKDTMYLEPYYHSVNTIPAEIRTLDSLVRDNIVLSRKVDTLEILINRQFNIIHKILSLKNSGPITSEEEALVFAGRNNMNEIRSIIKRIAEVENRIFEIRLSSETDFRNIAPLALLLFTLTALIGVSLLFSKINVALDKQRIAEARLNENILALKSEVGIREFTQKTLRNVLDNSLDGIMAFRAKRNKESRAIEDFELILSNDIASKSTGKLETELIGKRLQSIFPIEGKDLFDTFKAVVQTGEPAQFEKLYQDDHFNGWYNITVVKLEDGFVVTFSDITSQKRQRLIMEERGLLLKEAEALANMGSWKWDGSTQTMIWSDGLFKILNKNSETFTPSWNSFLENVYPEDRDFLEDLLKKTIADKEGSTFEYRVEINGALRYLSLTSKPWESNTKTGLDILGTVIDVTDQKIYEAQLEQYTAELKRSNEDLEQFAYVASHDLQEPLRKIRAFGDRLSSRYKKQLDDQGEDYIKRMQSASIRMQTLIEDLLAFSRLSQSKDVFQRIDMNAIMKDVEEDLDSQIKREQAVLKIGEIPFLTGEKIQIKRLFQNLINNAIKFHKPNEVPIVEVFGRSVKWLEVKNQLGVVLPDIPYIMITVKDNGIGFDERFNEKIFNIFQRLHGRTEYEGTGIGLAICRKIVTNHKGYITARSKEDVGSEFIVVLPATLKEREL
jgi:signal transduction histidine kinase/CHASE3 domain sensor protein